MRYIDLALDNNARSFIYCVPTNSMKGENRMSKAIWQEKQVIIDEIKAKLENAEAAVVIDYMGITVEEANSMRKQLREADVDYTVYKNTLVKRAIEGTKFEGLADALAGPSALAISQTDATAPARVLNKVMKEFKKMEFKAGVIEGELLDAAGVQAVADIPSRDELIAKFMGSIQSPIANFARVINQIAEQKGEGAEA